MEINYTMGASITDVNLLQLTGFRIVGYVSTIVSLRNWKPKHSTLSKYVEYSSKLGDISN